MHRSDIWRIAVEKHGNAQFLFAVLSEMNEFLSNGVCQRFRRSKNVRFTVYAIEKNMKAPFCPQKKSENKW